MLSDRPYYRLLPGHVIDCLLGRVAGSMVSFDFRVLHAELPQYQGKSQESLDRLYYLHAIVLKVYCQMINYVETASCMFDIASVSLKSLKSC